MNKTIEKIINALETHEDVESISVLEELGTNSSDNEVRDFFGSRYIEKLKQETL